MLLAIVSDRLYGYTQVDLFRNKFHSKTALRTLY